MTYLGHLSLWPGDHRTPQPMVPPECAQCRGECNFPKEKQGQPSKECGKGAGLPDRAPHRPHGARVQAEQNQSIIFSHRQQINGKESAGRKKS